MIRIEEIVILYNQNYQWPYVLFRATWAQKLKSIEQGFSCVKNLNFSYKERIREGRIICQKSSLRIKVLTEIKRAQYLLFMDFEIV